MCERRRTEPIIFLETLKNIKKNGETFRKDNQESSNTEPMVKEKTAGKPVSNPKENTNTSSKLNDYVFTIFHNSIKYSRRFFKRIFYIIYRVFAVGIVSFIRSFVSGMGLFEHLDIQLHGVPQSLLSCKEYWYLAFILFLVHQEEFNIEIFKYPKD